MDKASYQKYVARRAPRSPVLKNCVAAFSVGGGIGLGAELLFLLYRACGVPLASAGSLVSVTLIFLTAVLTGLGIFDRIGRCAGAGTLVPVTGFANAVVSPALDNKSEGLLLGVGGKIFTVAGPVILFGTFAGALYGLVYYIARLFL